MLFISTLAKNGKKKPKDPSEKNFNLGKTCAVLAEKLFLPKRSPQKQKLSTIIDPQLTHVLLWCSVLTAES